MYSKCNGCAFSRRNTLGKCIHHRVSLSFPASTRKHSPIMLCNYVRTLHDHLDLLGHGLRRGLRRELLLVGDAETALDVLALRSVAELTGGEHVELLVSLVSLVVGSVEEDADDEGDDGDGGVVPDEMRVVGKRGESLGEGSREGSGEALDTHDEGPHVLGSLGVGVLEGGDGCEDLRDGDKDVDTGDGPDVDGRLVVGVLGVVVAGGLVHVVLENGSPQHGKSTEDETSGDLLDGREVDLVLAQEGVDVKIEDWENISNCSDRLDRLSE